MSERIDGSDPAKERLTQNSSKFFRWEMFSIFSIMLFPMSSTRSFSFNHVNMTDKLDDEDMPACMHKRHSRSSRDPQSYSTRYDSNKALLEIPNPRGSPSW